VNVSAIRPSALAESKVGWEIFLNFALKTGAIGVTEKEEFEDRNERALDQLCSLQARYQAIVIPRCASWPCCKARWLAVVLMWQTAGAPYRMSRPCGAGIAVLWVGHGYRWARESGGLREATYSWSPRPVIWWPRRWLGLSASR
jgi:hypothetical protein